LTNHLIDQLNFGVREAKRLRDLIRQAAQELASMKEQPKAFEYEIKE